MFHPRNYLCTQIKDCMDYQYHRFKSYRLILLLLAVPFALTFAQQTNPKFSMTTQLFLDELNRSNQSAAAPGRPEVTYHAPKPVGNNLIASPIVMDGVAYISCFIHLVDPTDLSALEALGVRDMQTYGKLSFITANVPITQLEALAALDNVTQIKVSELMRPTTYEARKQTGVTDLLTMSPAVTGRGISTRYDGSGVVLGIVDTGIDFRHIAFKDKDGNCRIKHAFIYDGTYPYGLLYIDDEDFANPDSMPTTDNIYMDHGTHTASTAGGSSVIVDKIDSAHFVLNITENHDSATYGGMAPGADLYIGAVYDLNLTSVIYAIYFMMEYADTVDGGKPLVVSNSWGTDAGPRNGHSEFAQFVGEFFGDDHPNRIILFAAGNEVGDGGTGGVYVRKPDANASHPLGAIIRTDDGTSGDYYESGYLADAWSDSVMNCTFYVLDNSTGNILWSKTVSPSSPIIDSIYSVGAQNDTTWFYTGMLIVLFNNDAGFQQNYAISYTPTGLITTAPGAYSLAMEVYPAEGTCGINMWGYGDCRFATGNTITAGHTWVNGTDDMCVTDETTISEAISVGAYVSKNKWYNYVDELRTKNMELGDIATFSNYALPELSPTGQQYPTITAPGSMLISAVNHYHTAEVDASSYYLFRERLIVNDSINPYGAMQGTSMATPTAAGIVALWLQAASEVGKTLTPNQVKDIMARTASHDYYTVSGPNAARFGKGKIDALAGIHFITDDVLDLYDTAYNDTKISVNSDTILNVMLCGRTLYKDNGWNTLCLPFDLPLAGSVLAGATLVELDPTSSGYDGTTLTLNFSSATSIEAGKPYLIKWPEGSDITYPLFENVALQNASTIVTSDDNSVAFIGIYSPVTLNANNWRTLSMGANNTLYYPDSDMSLGAFRAVFLLNNASQAPSRIVLNVNGETVATDLAVLQESNPGFPQVEDADGRGTKFIANGQLYIRRGGVIYDSLGRKVKPQYNNR